MIISEARGVCVGGGLFLKEGERGKCMPVDQANRSMVEDTHSIFEGHRTPIASL